MRIRRARLVPFSITDDPSIDFVALLRGEVEVDTSPKIAVTSLLRGEEYICESVDLELLLSLSSTDWVDRAEIESRLKIDPDILQRSIARGLIITDAPNLSDREDRTRDEEISARGWEQHAATYHYLNRWSNVTAPNASTSGDDGLIDKDSSGILGKLLEDHGEPPSHFHTYPEILSTVQLPAVTPSNELDRTLLSRKTTRSFDATKKMNIDELSSLLYMTWGCHGLMNLTGTVAGLKKTSPSGGDLHPTEAYAVIQHVDGIQPGIYHYNVEHHRLDLVRHVAGKLIPNLIAEFAAGQEYFADAHVLFVMTVRFGRSYWKYRNHALAYRVMHLDIGHLSQSLYLLGASKGLGVFLSAAINHRQVEEHLGLDDTHEAAIAVAGCGYPADELLELTFDFESYTPW